MAQIDQMLNQGIQNFMPKEEEQNVEIPEVEDVDKEEKVDDTDKVGHKSEEKKEDSSQ